MKKSTLPLLLLLSSISILVAAMKKKTVLSFGGNGMIGSAVLHRMIESKEYDITLVSRGNWHYDSNVRIKPFVEAVVCNRNQVPNCEGCSINALKHCDRLVEVVDKAKKGFDVVLDFSAYEPKWIHDAIDLLQKKKVGVYIYISSDAVYEVSVPKSIKRLSQEDNAIRPTDPKLRDKLNAQDPYGNAKFGGEEVLQDQRKDGTTGFPWVAFRYADVVGPRDVTRRFAFYHTWLKFYEDIGVPFYLPKKLEDVNAFTLIFKKMYAMQ
jgi:nucleoside-diphosphate-sugar epimerase